MPTGMETTVKLRIGEYLLTGVIFGGVLYPVSYTHLDVYKRQTLDLPKAE